MSFNLMIAFIIGAVLFVIAFIIGFLANSLSVSDGLLAGSVAGITVTISIFIISERDRRRFRKIYKNRQKFLRERDSICEAEYVSSFSPEDGPLARNIRESLAAFFEVTADRIHANDDLQTVLWFDRFAPNIGRTVTMRGLNLLGVEIAPNRIIKIHEAECKTIHDLVRHVRRVSQSLLEYSGP